MKEINKKNNCFLTCHQLASTQSQGDSGGDDSSKENKENSANGDESNNAVKTKKGL